MLAPSLLIRAISLATTATWTVFTCVLQWRFVFFDVVFSAFFACSISLFPTLLPAVNTSVSVVGITVWKWFGAVVAAVCWYPCIQDWTGDIGWQLWRRGINKRWTPVRRYRLVLFDGEFVDELPWLGRLRLMGHELIGLRRRCFNWEFELWTGRWGCREGPTFY